jgi:hypothetical protein
MAMRDGIRITNWNIDRPWRNGKTRRAALQKAHLHRLASGVTVITESWTEFALDGQQGVHSLGSDLYPGYDRSERAVSIWVRSDWRTEVIERTELSVCARVVPDLGPQLLVVGGLIPYRDAGSPPWATHVREALHFSADWVRLRCLYPDHVLCVAGDFNMTLDGDGGYGTPAGRQAVRQGLRAAGLICHTAMRAPKPGVPGQSRGNIDHICIDSRVALASPVSAWAAEDRARALSDHNGMTVDLQWPAQLPDVVGSSPGRSCFAELLGERPAQWGLRGDPHLWNEMTVLIGSEPMPSSAEALARRIAGAFEQLAGVPLASARELLSIDRYPGGGMSGGMVDPHFWRETAIPLLIERATRLGAFKAAHVPSEIECETRSPRSP